MACRIDTLINSPTESLADTVDVQEAAAFMARQDLGSVVVTRSNQVIGLFTEKDLIKRVVGLGKNPKTVTLGEVCSRKLISVSDDASCENAIKTMRSNRCRRLLVYHKDSFLGLVTLPEIAQRLAEQRSRKNALVNVAGGVTLFVTLAVIGLWLYHLPDMARLAMTIMKQ
jgi:signal-transduction protein with cAMP-binding, CBS, and nucleotidyltransferase domain